MFTSKWKPAIDKGDVVVRMHVYERVDDRGQRLLLLPLILGSEAYMLQPF